MRLWRIAVSEGATSYVKIFVMGVYLTLAIKLGIIDTDTNPLFALAMVLLSIYVLWIVVRRASKYLVGVIEGSGERDGVPNA